MKGRSRGRWGMKFEMQRNILSNLAKKRKHRVCAPPPYLQIRHHAKAKECFCVSHKKGSLTIEAALLLPFFMTILLSFFSLFHRYSTAAELKIQAAEEAKKIALAEGVLDTEIGGDVTISRSENLRNSWNLTLLQNQKITQKAVCRAWIGFTGLENEETYVYITPEGSVYHLRSECTHLDLSIHLVTLTRAKTQKNQQGERYKKCELCKEEAGVFVYITNEGNRYHSDRSCSGLKRTIRMVPLSSVPDRNCCHRCREKEE